MGTYTAGGGGVVSGVANTSRCRVVMPWGALVGWGSLAANWWLHIKSVINFNLARIGSRKLQTVSATERAAAVNTLAELLTSKQERILDANATDLAEATKAGLAKPLLSRLSLSAGKLNNLATGLRQIADSSEKVGLFASLIFIVLLVATR